MLKRNHLPPLFKVMKYQLKNFVPSITIIYSILAGVTLMNILFGVNGVISKFVYTQYSIMKFFSGLSELLMGAMLFASIIMTIAFIKKSLYSTMIKGEAYLTHTLPVTENELICGKFIVSMLFLMVTVLLCIGAGELTEHLSNGEFNFATKVNINGQETVSRAFKIRFRICTVVGFIVTSGYLISVIFTSVANKMMPKIVRMILPILIILTVFLLPMAITSYIDSNILNEATIENTVLGVAYFVYGIELLAAVGNMTATHLIFNKKLNLN